MTKHDFLKVLAALALLGAVACGSSEPAAAEADSEATSGEEAPVEEAGIEEEAPAEEAAAEEEAPAEEGGEAAAEGEAAPE